MKDEDVTLEPGGVTTDRPIDIQNGTSAVFEVDPTLDVPSFVPVFRERRRLLIPRIFRPTNAELLYKQLSKDFPWGITFRKDAGTRHHFSPKELESRDPAQAREIFDLAYSTKGTSSSHVFSATEIHEMPPAPTEEGTPFHRFSEFANSEAFTGFLCELTGLPKIGSIDIVATRYLPWHFYAFHLDTREDKEILGAFVWNLTPAWMPQWGGLLRFRNAAKEIVDTFVPRFNSMSIFLASEEHSVTIVAPYAADGRYAIGGQLLL